MSANPIASEISAEQLYSMVRELTADLELRAVLRKVISFTLKTVGATAGSIVVLDENGQVTSASIMEGERLYDNTTLQLSAVLARGLAGWVIRHKQPVLIPDTSTDERWLPNPQAPEESDSRSAIAVPLIVKQQLVGVFTVVHTQPHAFQKEHFAWVQAIADFASTMVMNALLYARSRRQARLMQVWAESAMTITSTLDTKEIIQRMLKQVERALRVEAVLLAMGSEHSSSWIVTDASGVMADRLLGVRLQPPAQSSEPQCPLLDVFEVFAVRAVACAPLTQNNEAVGAIIAINPLEGQFRPDMEDLLQGIANMASTALQHARLFQEASDAYQQYRALFNDTLDWIFITNLQGFVIEANQRAKVNLGYTWETLRNGSLSITSVHHSPSDRLPENLHDIPSSPPITYESEVRTQHGEAIPVAVYVRRVTLRGKPHLQWILRDITERKRLDTLRDDLLAMLYHDLRAPLSNISMSLEILQQNCEGDESANLITIAQRATDRMNRLTTNMLDLSRLEAGQMPLQPRRVLPNELIAKVVEIVAPHAQQREHSLEIETDTAIPAVYADDDIIRRVLINLLENAIKYTSPGGHISVGATREDNMVRFWVTDSGPGIPEEEQQHIFQKYARINRRGTGLGLGLAFARMAVQAHGGTIGLQSTLGEGSTFYFTLPIDNTTAAEA